MSRQFRGVQNPKAKLTPDKVRRIRRSSAGGIPGRDLAEKYGVTTTTICLIVTGRSWVDVGGPVRSPRDHRLSHHGAGFCRLDGYDVEHTTNDGVLVVRCLACERRRAGRCMDCGGRVQGKAWRCERHRIAAQDRAVLNHKIRNREQIAQRALAALHRKSPEERHQLREYKKVWRRNNPRKVYAQKRRARLRGNGGYATREKFLAYHRAYRARHKVAA